jgi:hypothetical protein
VYSYTDLYHQAIRDRRACYRRDGGRQQILSYGIMLVKHKEFISILNTTKAGGYYADATPDELEHLFKYGWKQGVLMIAINNYTRKLDVIEFKIQNEMNTRKNDKFIRGLKNSRDKLLLKYTQRKSELKLLQNEK